MWTIFYHQFYTSKSTQKTPHHYYYYYYYYYEHFLFPLLVAERKTEERQVARARAWKEGERKTEEDVLSFRVFVRASSGELPFFQRPTGPDKG